MPPLKSTKYTINVAVVLNNRSVALLGRGEYKRAIHSLANAFGVCKSILNDGVSGRSSWLSLDRIMRYGEHSIDADARLRQTENPLFLKPITISRQLSQSCENIGVLLIILMFNQALAHHLLALRSPEYIKKAIELYEYGLYVVSENNLGGRSSMYVLACLNNMATLYPRLGNKKAGKECLQKLLSTLMLLTNSTEADGRPQSLSIFFRSVTNLMGSQIAAAAA